MRSWIQYLNKEKRKLEKKPRNASIHMHKKERRKEGRKERKREREREREREKESEKQKT